ncbi:MAG: hypothetical protein AAB895_00895, partial [Patescibacteria group bacterium]
LAEKYIGEPGRKRSIIMNLSEIKRGSIYALHIHEILPGESAISKRLELFCVGRGATDAAYYNGKLVVRRLDIDGEDVISTYDLSDLGMKIEKSVRPINPNPKNPLSWSNWVEKVRI